MQASVIDRLHPWPRDIGKVLLALCAAAFGVWIAYLVRTEYQLTWLPVGWVAPYVADTAHQIVSCLTEIAVLVAGLVLRYFGDTGETSRG